MLYLLPLTLALLIVAVSCCAEPIVLENDWIRLDIEPEHGVFSSIHDKASGIALEPPAGMADNFKLVLLKPDKTAVAILGKDQKLTEHQFENKDDRLVLDWIGPLRDTEGNEHKINVRLKVTVVYDKLEFVATAENNSDSKIQEVWYPLIGGVSDFAPDASAWIPISTPWEKPLMPPFGHAAFQYPGHMNMSFACVSSKSLNRSIYFASEDIVARYKVFHLMEVEGKDGKDVFLAIHHAPFTAPGTFFEGSPVALRFVEGDWRAAGQVYRKWFIDSFGIASVEKDWIRRQSFFIFTMFALPEGTINYTFKDIPKWAKAAKECGLNAVQISGWQLGGHDNGYPYYIPDPRLGTWKELEDGVRACHEMGLKVDFFVNYQPMMVESNWYKQELSKYREMTAEGGHTWMAGWGMGTLSARMGHPKLMTWADLGFPQFRKIIVDQFSKLAQIGADGVHVDKMFPAGLCFNPDSPLPPDMSTWEGAILLGKEVMTECRKHNPNWSMSFECNWDRMLQFGGATWWVGNQLITRKIFPENAETLAITMAYDYLGINNAVRNGHVIMLAPLSFSRGMDWQPMAGLGRYIKEVKRIRDSLQDAVFLGEVLGQTGIKMGNAEAGVEYNVFRNRKTGRKVCVLTNSGREAKWQEIAGFERKATLVRIHTSFEKSYAVKLPTIVEVPGEQVVFVEEIASTSVSPSPQSSPAKGRGGRATHAAVENGDFETGSFDGWIADPNWVVADDSRVYYSGWQGKCWAWSGGKGEAATGKLRSKPFTLDKDAVRMLISGWDSVMGTGNPRKWNYVTLNLEDGTEIDRVYAPNTTVFVPVFLDGSKHKGKKVYIEAVDDADQPSFAMLCIDDVRTADLPADMSQPVRVLPPFDPKKSIALENGDIRIEVSKSNGSVTRIFDKKSGLDLILEPRLGGSYRFALIIPGKEPWQGLEANWIFGKHNKLSSYSIDGSKLTLVWNGPLKNYLGANFNASVNETIELVDGGALFSMSIDNKSNYHVGEVYFPIIGGIQGLGKTKGQLKSTNMVRPAPNDTYATTNIFYSFGNMSAFGDQGPEQFYSYPEGQPEPWVGFSCEKAGQGVYIGSRDTRKQVIRLELQPSSSGTPREDGNWPREEELKGQPCGVELSFVEIADFHGRKVYQAAPVFVKFTGSEKAALRETHVAWKAGK